MAQLNVSVPDPMKEWVETQVDGGRFSTTSDYVRDLIRRDQDAQSDRSSLQKMVDHALESGISDQTPKEIFAEARRRIKDTASA